MNTVRTYFVLASLALVLSCEASFAQYLTGSDRAEFVRGAANSCVRKRPAEMQVIPNSLFAEYCRCYSNGLADRLTAAQIRAENDAVTQPVIDGVVRICYQAMKDEAIRLHKAGQYPKS
jgi:hypothetical protein